MAKKPRSPGLVTIKYKDIYTIAAIVIGILVLLVSLWVWWRTSGNPGCGGAGHRKGAEDAGHDDSHSQARREGRRVAGADHAGQAKTEFGAGRFPKAIRIAQEVVDMLQPSRPLSHLPKFAVLVAARAAWRSNASASTSSPTPPNR